MISRIRLLKTGWLGLTCLLALPAPNARAQDPAPRGREPRLAPLGTLVLPNDPGGLLGPDGPNLRVPGTFDPLYDSLVRQVDGTRDGLTLAELDRITRAQLDVPEDRGRVVLRVEPDSPASFSDLEVNDIVLSVNDRPVRHGDEFHMMLDKAGDKVPAKIAVIRAGKPMTIEWKASPEPADAKKEPERREYWIGVQVNKVDDVLRSHLGLPDGQGLIVPFRIDPQSPAAKAGIKTNDVLLTIAGRPLNTVQTLIDQVQASEGKPVKVELLRRREKMTVEITPESRVIPARGRMDNLRLRRGGQWEQMIPGPGVMFGRGRLLPNAPNAVGGRMIPGIGTDYLDRRMDEVTRQIQSLRESMDELRRSIEKDEKDRKAPDR